MPYDVVIETEDKKIRTKINELKELRDLLLKYDDVYIGVQVTKTK